MDGQAWRKTGRRLGDLANRRVRVGGVWGGGGTTTTRPFVSWVTHWRLKSTWCECAVEARPHPRFFSIDAPKKPKILLDRLVGIESRRMRTKNPIHPPAIRLLDAAQELMLAKGYVATTVDEICTAAGVTKGSFFHYFRNKEEFGEGAVGAVCASPGVGLRQCVRCDRRPPGARLLSDWTAPSLPPPNPRRRVVSWAPSLRKSRKRIPSCGGCASVVSIVSPAASPATFSPRRRDTRPRRTFDAEGLGIYFLALAQGSMLLSKTTGDRSAVGRNLTHFKGYLKTLYGR